MKTKQKTSKVNASASKVILPNGSIINEPKLAKEDIHYEGIILKKTYGTSLTFFDNGYEFFKSSEKTSTLDCEIAIRLADYMCHETNIVKLNLRLISDLYIKTTAASTNPTWFSIVKVLNRLEKRRVLSKLDINTYMINPLVFFHMENINYYSERNLSRYKESMRLRDSMTKHFYDSISKNNKMGQVIARNVVLSIYNDQL